MVDDFCIPALQLSQATLWLPPAVGGWQPASPAAMPPQPHTVIELVEWGVARQGAFVLATREQARRASNLVPQYLPIT